MSSGSRSDRPLRIGFRTLGCKLNQYETDAIATEMRTRGYEIVSDDEKADAYVVNTCTVTNKADRKSRQSLYQAARMNPEALVVATGCHVDSHREELRERNQGYVVGNAHKNRIPDLLDAYFRGEITNPEELGGNVFGFTPPSQVFHTRTNVKIQDGCDNFCSFCIIPHVRGRAISRPLVQVVDEVRSAVRTGSKEIVLTGVNMSRYQTEDADFPTLAREILRLDGDFRLRISSLEPDQLDDRFVSLFDHPRMSPHLHLCVQSGSDRVLARMRRMYTSVEFRRIVESLRGRDPLFNVTTDVIVGFPGETEDDLDHTVQLVRDVNFGHVHLFPFSVRRGTAASHMPDKLPNREITRRAKTVRQVAQTEKAAYRSQLVGTTETVLIERVHRQEQQWIGYGFGQHYVPIRVESSEILHRNQFYNVDVLSVYGANDGGDPQLIGTVARRGSVCC